MKYQLGIIGLGNMGRAILLGVLKRGLYKAEDIAIYDPEFESYCNQTVNIEGYTVHIASNPTLAQESAILILAIKPNFYEQVLNQIHSSLNPKTLLISITPSYSLGKIEKIIGPYKIVHAMPNTPTMVGEGMTGVCFNNQIREEERQKVLDLFAQIGQVKDVYEDQLKAVTAISGSSPAFVYMLIESMAQAAIAEGLSRQDAYLFASQAVKGAAQMVLETKLHPAILRDQVCSPSGTTIQGVKALEEHGFTSAIMKAVEATAKQFEKMQKE